MSIHTDHNVTFVGNEVHFRAGASESHTLQPGDFYDVIADVVGGTISVGVESLDLHTPSFVRVVGPQADPEFQTWFNCVAISVQLYRGEEDEPIRTITTLGGQKREGEQESQFAVDAGPIAVAPTHTRWRLRVRNTSRTVVTTTGGMGFVRDREFIGETRVPLRVLNHAFGVVINALAPHATVRGRTLRYGFGEELAHTLGLQGDHPLREQTTQLDDIPSFVDAAGELQSIKAEIVPGTVVRAAVADRWQQEHNRILALAGVVSDPRLLAALQVQNNAWRAAWDAKIEPDLVAVHITALISDIDLSAGVIPGVDFAGAIEDISMQLYLVFERLVGHQSGHVLFLASADYAGAAAAAGALGLVPSVQEIMTAMTPGIEPHIGLLHRYFAEVLARIAPFLGDVPPIFIDARADETSVLVRYTLDPKDQRATIPASPQGQPVGGLPHLGHLDETRPLGGSGGMLAEQPSEPVDHGPLGAVPAEFELGDPLSVARLDKITTIVVVMMENRSFDHLLGFLRTVRGAAYTGFPDSASNSYIDDGVSHTVEMEPITNVLRADEVTQIRVSPNHDFVNVQEQLAEGAMSGFATDLLGRGDPQFALTYYTDQQIPNYYRLAAGHMVCDHWYCAHPGPTYPNRWATLTGTIPQVENLDVDDRRLGFLRDRTIFETLTSAGIDWNYYEHNVSMIRMYQQYRLDDTHVLPYGDPLEGFERKAAAGTLPPVVFVEPRFTGIPPLEQASDDHPPADLVAGQQFITRVYNTLAQAPQWGSTLLVITYDEHGGFFDHVAPPGTRLGPVEWRTKVPRIHPQGADHMGPRVPTFVISPLVNPGTVSHAVFDHTSIIKTILVRHRDKFVANQFGAFGPRVMMINHLGAALDRDEARPGHPEVLPAPPLRSLTERRARPLAPGMSRRRATAPPAEDERTDFHVSLARAMLPKRA